MDQFDATHAISLASNITDGQNRQIYPGTVIGGDYRLKKLLGRGGMGYVFLAEHIIIQKDYALKLVAETELSPVARQRFESEGRAIAALNHQNIVKVQNMGLDSHKNPFYVMDLLDGETLAAFVSKPVAFNELIDLFIQVADGLSYAHRKDIIHRDVKPSNILIVKENDKSAAKIVDFGIAKFISANSDLQANTKHGEILGSPLYMSPEQACGEAVDARSDIYSLGCTLFECINGSAPFKGTTAMQTLLMHQNEPVPDLKEVCQRQGIPTHLNTVIGKMLAKKREKRYQNMEQLIHDLERIKSGLSVGLKEMELPTELAAENESSTTTIVPEHSQQMPVFPVAVGAVLLIGALIIGATVFGTKVFGLIKPQPPAPIEMSNNQDQKLAETNKTSTFERSADNFANSFFASTDENFLRNEMKESAQAKAAYSKIKAIRAQQLIVNGRKIKRIVFPDWTIGRVLTPTNGGVEAIGTKDFATNEPLVLDCGAEKSHQIFSLPFILTKIDNNIFDAFFVTGRTFNVEALPSEKLLKIENDGLISMLKTIQKWNSLKQLALAKLTISDQALQSITSLTNLETLQIRKCNLDSRKLGPAPLLKKLTRLQIQSISNVKPILNGVAHSKSLQLLQLYGCKLSSDDLRLLFDCPNLHTLEISGKSLPELISTIALLPHLKRIRIGDSTLSLEQIHELTKMKTLEKLYLKEQSYDFSAIEKIEAAEPKVEIYTSTPE